MKKTILLLLIILGSGGYALHQLYVYKRKPQTTYPRIYFSEQLIDLRRLFYNALDRAQERIDLYMYHLSDPLMIQYLQVKSKEGLALSLTCDPSCPRPHFIDDKNIHIPSLNGLMHEKILIIDDQEIWIGSANWTTDSLGVNENSVVSLHCPQLIDTLRSEKKHHHFMSGGQRIEFWRLPHPDGLSRLLDLINTSHEHIHVALYALTHPDIVWALILAHRRGVLVEVILDRQMSSHINLKAIQQLTFSGIPVRCSQGIGLLHHKLAWIDQSLVLGSANWTQAAFSRNQESFVILHEVTTSQRKTLKRAWKILQMRSNQSFELPYSDSKGCSEQHLRFSRQVNRPFARSKSAIDTRKTTEDVEVKPKAQASNEVTSDIINDTPILQT